MTEQQLLALCAAIRPADSAAMRAAEARQAGLAKPPHSLGLLEQLGEPLSQSYEESCSGPGDDGIWQYEGFIVFTYREDGAETVVDAEAD